MKTFIEIFVEFIGKNNLAELEDNIKQHYANPIKFHKDYDLLLINDIPDIDKLFDAIGATSGQRENYRKQQLTVHQLFNQLMDDNLCQTHQQFEHIVAVIQSVKTTQKLKFALMGLVAGTVFVTVVSGLMTSQGLLTNITNFVQGLIPAIVGRLPVIGLVGTVSLFAVTLVQYNYNPTKPFWRRVVDNVFSIAENAFNVASYGLWIAAATAIMTPLVAGLSVAASSVSVFKEVVSLIRERRQYQEEYKKLNEWKINPLGFRKTPVDKAEALNKEALIDKARARHEANSKLHWRSFFTNFTAAVCIVGVIAVWNFFPPALFVTVGCIAAIVAVYAIKTLVLKVSNSSINKELQNNLEGITKQLDADLQATKTAEPAINVDKKAEKDSSLKMIEGLSGMTQSNSSIHAQKNVTWDRKTLSKSCSEEEKISVDHEESEKTTMIIR
ncbi:hypothetical protein [Legionella fairfieldensis]|uniref:hypothetical protein n=1 Tax=Legionella fairfieldensis TaxID=45064 RepID=UPI000B339B0E|nr:hypothetical protein [Legionella fairfieldensis]